MEDKFKQINILSPDDLSYLEREFQGNILASRVEMQAVWKSLHELFKKKNAVDDFAYRNSYFRWYSDLTWRISVDLSREDFISVAVGRQLMMGLLLSVDVWDRIIGYLGTRGLDEKDVRNLYSQIKQAVFSSQEVIGKNKQGEIVTLGAVAMELEGLNRKGNNSVEMAEFYTRLKDGVYTFGELDLQYFRGEPEKVLRRFVDLIHFFLGVSEDSIWVIVDTYMYPEWYSAIENSMNIQEEVAHEGRNTSIESQVELVQTPVHEVEKNLAPSYADIKSMITSRFSTDETGQFTNIEGVLALLDSLAVEYNDDRIRELYYFDESTGTFHWNDELT